ncbi:MAG: prepilin-type N-terminal cleavage/methylation domain-containing protein [Egibacteraceae bacterium]
MLSDRVRSEGGATLVELLVVMVLLSIVGGVVTTGLVSGMQAQRRAQARIDALSELQRAMERTTRELRGADPVISVGGDTVTVHVPALDGSCAEVTYLRSGTVLREQRASTAPGAGCAAFGAPTERNQLSNLANATVSPVVAVFTYADAGGSPVTDPVDVRRIAVTLLRDLPEQDPVRLESTVTIRNAGT